MLGRAGQSRVGRAGQGKAERTKRRSRERKRDRRDNTAHIELTHCNFLKGCGEVRGLRSTLTRVSKSYLAALSPHHPPVKGCGEQKLSLCQGRKKKAALH